MKLVEQIKEALQSTSSEERRLVNLRYFKTGLGEYGEGDRFIGCKMPDMRKIARDFRSTDYKDLKILLNSPIHEHRLTALLILVLQVPKIPNDRLIEIKDFYLDHVERVNNWDLVDGSAPYIMGPYCQHYGSDILYDLVTKDHLWSQRIAIVSTWHLIRQGELHDTYALSEILLEHSHDLMHKAVGWMLREAGKKDLKRLKSFLQKHYNQTPRTTLRYAIEKFPEPERKQALKGVF